MPRRCGPFHTFFFVLAMPPALLIACALGGRGLPPPLSDARLDSGDERDARRLYERGVAEVGERRYESAHAAFDSLVEIYPGSSHSTVALRERGLAAYRLGRHGEAAADLRRLLNAAPEYETTDTAIVLASALQRGGEPQEALRSLVRYLPEGDQGVEGARLVAEAAVGALRNGEARELAEELTERRFLAALYARAAEEVRASNPDLAAEYARRAVRLGEEGRSATRLARERERERRGEDAGGGRAVGAILPQSGRLANVGREIEQGARLALEELASSGGPAYTLEVVPEAGAASIAAVDRLADRGVRIVIGPLESEAAVVAAQGAAERGILLVSPTATDSSLARMAPAVAAPNAATGNLGAAMGRFAAQDLGLLSVAVIGADDEYGRGHARGFRTAFERAGGRVALEMLFPRGATNYGAALRQAHQLGAQALFLPSRSADQVLTVLSQVAYYSGGSFHLLGTEVWRDERFLQRAGEFAEGAYFADTFSPDSRVTRYWDFRTLYFKRYGRSLTSNFPAWGYDAIILALRYLAEPARANSVEVSGAGTAPATYVGAAATYRIRDGVVEKVPVISRISSGIPVLSRFEGSE